MMIRNTKFQGLATFAARSMTAPNMPAPSDRLRHYRSTSKDRDHLDVFIQSPTGLQHAEKSCSHYRGDVSLALD